MAKFVVHITEVLGRNVIIEAEDPAEAEESAEELCNSEVINLGMADWSSRSVEYIGSPTEDAYERLVSYCRNKDERKRNLESEGEFLF